MFASAVAFDIRKPERDAAVTFREIHSQRDAFSPSIACGPLSQRTGAAMRQYGCRDGDDVRLWRYPAGRSGARVLLKWSVRVHDSGSFRSRGSLSVWLCCLRRFRCRRRSGARIPSWCSISPICADRFTTSCFRDCARSSSVMPTAHVTLYGENLDLTRFGGPAYEQSLKRHLKEKYRDKADRRHRGDRRGHARICAALARGIMARHSGRLRHGGRDAISRGSSRRPMSPA